MIDPIEFVCESCNSECIVQPIEDSEMVEVRYCPYCGEAIDNELDLTAVNFDLNDDYE